MDNYFNYQATLIDQMNSKTDNVIKQTWDKKIKPTIDAREVSLKSPSLNIATKFMINIKN